MMILRATTKVFKKFSHKPKLIEVDRSENDFGEWYVNTADSFNRGNLFMLVMHADSLYTMLVPIEKGIGMTNFVHTVFANLMLRLLRMEIPRESVEQIMKSYDGQAVFSKTKSRSLLGHLNNILQDIEAMVEYREDIAKDNKLDMARLEYGVNDSPRTMNGKYVWPVEMFYGCIRNLCPKLPHRIPLPLDMLVRYGTETIAEIFQNRVPDKLLLKINGSALSAEVLFSYEEVQTLLKAVNDSHKQSSGTYKDLYPDVKRMLNSKIEKFDIEM